MNQVRWICVIILSSQAAALNFGLTAEGHDSRVDLAWQGRFDSYNIYRSDSESGPFVKINEKTHPYTVYSDFFGENGKTYYYRITAVNSHRRESPPSNIVSATSRKMTDDQLLESVQKATFRYFWDHAHPDSGLIRERSSSGDTCTSGGTGFGIMAIIVGAERGFISRAQASRRVDKILTFLEKRTKRLHGAYSHWIDGKTGQIRPFSQYDDGADIVETAYLIQGILTAKQYFKGTDRIETKIRQAADRIWQDVEWDWFLMEKDSKVLYWHWSENHGWKMNHKIGGHFNECMITYILAIASRTHGIDPDCYYEGWAGGKDGKYANGKSYYGYKLDVGWPKGGPLFFTHYSFLGFDPRNKGDMFCNYFENNRQFTLINRAYCIENPRDFTGYGENLWGLTASDTPGGYTAHSPSNDNGTITPTAALSSIVYTPAESIAVLKCMYHKYGSKIWGHFGFIDAFNLEKDWYADSYLAIDQGPIVIMIENYRSQLCWKLFMANPEILPALKAMGWKIEDK